MKHVFVVVLAFAMIFAGCSAQESQDVEMPTEDMGSSQEPIVEGDSEPDVTVSFVGRNFEYEDEQGNINPTITVQQGDLVRIEYTTESGFHDVVIDEFGGTEQVGADAGLQVLEFVADQAGEFEYYCSVGSHRAQGMFGTFIVE